MWTLTEKNNFLNKGNIQWIKSYKFYTINQIQYSDSEWTHNPSQLNKIKSAPIHIIVKLSKPKRQTAVPLKQSKIKGTHNTEMVITLTANNGGVSLKDYRIIIINHELCS